MPIIERADGKLEFETFGKVSVLDPKDSEGSIRMLLRIVTALEQRIAKLER